MSEAGLRMWARLAVVLSLHLAAASAAQARPPTVLSEKSAPISVIDSKVIDEINFARTKPGAYAELLRMTPGTPAAQEAIGLLQHRMPVEPLTLNDRLSAAASKHAAEQGALGGVSHLGADGSSPAVRMRREGVFSGITSEDMSLGQGSARDIVRQLIIDEGVPSRSHRTDLLDPLLRLGGAGCAPHPTYRIICIIDLASPPPPP